MWDYCEIKIRLLSDYFCITERLLQDYWKITERLMRDNWEITVRLLQDYWKLMWDNCEITYNYGEITARLILDTVRS